MKFEFTVKGLKSLQKLDKTVAKKILKKIKYWQGTNNPLSYSEPIQELSGLFRYRVGDWRIIVSPDFEKKRIDILKVGHRSKIYNKL
jgi:mRNA interferase RelE/StbE